MSPVYPRSGVVSGGPARVSVSRGELEMLEEASMEKQILKKQRGWEVG